MKEQRQEFERWLAEQITAHRRHSKQLAEDDRMDEGNFEKIRANVYEIFKTVLSASEKVCGKDDAARRRFFLQKAAQIPSGWADSYEKARQNGDAEKMHIERMKLDTIQEIQEMCMRIWEETA